MKTLTTFTCTAMIAALVFDSACVAFAQEPIERVPPSRLIDTVSPTNALVPYTPSVLTITSSAPSAATPRITNTITRVGRRPDRVFSNSVSSELVNKLDGRSKSPSQSVSAWPEPMPAQLVVIVSPPTITGEKILVKLAIKNGLSEKIESARAAVFLLDEHGKMVGNAAKWVIERNNTNGLETGATNTFHFVIPSTKPLSTTNLTARVEFSRLVLESGKLADASKAVQIQNSQR